MAHEGRERGTPGGVQLRTLRRRLGKTQLWVEVEAELGTGYLQRVESGRVIQPARPTLERILAALGARYSERRAILERFGYAVATPLPTADEAQWACTATRHDLDEFPFPAYVLDCSVRLVAWNRRFPQLLGIAPGDPLLAKLTGQSLLAAWFDPASPLAPLVAEPDVFLPALIRALRFELRQFRMESWAAALVSQLRDELPRFRHYWTLAIREPDPAGAGRALAPVRLVPPHTPILQFRLASEPLTRDARFRVIYYFPDNPETMHHCAAWAAEEGREVRPTRRSGEH